MGFRQVQRAIRSLFLYEHVITPKTRWQARVCLWERDRFERLPPFVEQCAVDAVPLLALPGRSPGRSRPRAGRELSRGVHREGR